IPRSIAAPCAEKRTLACQQVLLSHKWLIAIHSYTRFLLESIAAQWVWVSQQALVSAQVRDKHSIKSPCDR
ncbi:MAG: hypothetical protein VKJ05_07610, partial [Synechococcaceae cyanobacterium]|nr:hypothetical protein [Synechococcaceae cyanobacterium]